MQSTLPAPPHARRLLLSLTARHRAQLYPTIRFAEGRRHPRRRMNMSEGYTIDADNETVGIVVRYEGERGFRFHSASKTFDAIDGQVFVNPAAAQRAAREFARARTARLAARSEGSLK